MQPILQRAALLLFALYVMVYPGSLVTVALDRVPEWGIWMGSALLILQGAIMLAWLGGRYGGRGLVAGLLVAALGFLVEFVGDTTGFPFGSYTYTDVLQPQILGIVPLAIPAAWLLVVPAAYEIVRRAPPQSWFARFPLMTVATLVLILDLQIETVAVYANNYWIWFESGPYYGVPTTNFIAWWFIGLGMAWVVSRLVGSAAPAQEPAARLPFVAPRISEYLVRNLPALLYVMITAMFVATNLGHGFLLAGLIGVVVLLVALFLVIRGWPAVAGGAALRRTYD